MRYIFSMLMLFVLAVGLACQNASSTSMTEKPADGEKKNTETAEKVATETKTENVDEHGHEDDAPRISLADAKKDFDAGEVVFVDTRAESSYKTEHIKGAINIPASDFEARYKEIPTDKKIVAYCS